MSLIDLQIFLAAKGFYAGAIDGRQGPATIAAIKAFQRSVGLKDDGVVGRATLDKLGAPVHQLAMTMSPEGVDLIKGFEGLGDGDPKTVLLEAYFDGVGFATLGWGHLISDAAGRSIQARFKGDPAAKARADAAVVALFGRPAISRDQAKSLLSVDINAKAGEITPFLQATPTAQSEFDALMSLAFNIGARGFGGSTVLARHKAGLKVPSRLDLSELEQASQRGETAPGMAGAFGAWSRSGGEWTLGLFRRRMAETMRYRGDLAADTIAATARIR